MKSREAVFLQRQILPAETCKSSSRKPLCKYKPRKPGPSSNCFWKRSNHKMTLVPPTPASWGIKWTHWRRSLTWKNIQLNWCLVLNLSRCKLGTTENWCLTGLTGKMKVFSGAPPQPTQPGSLKEKQRLLIIPRGVSHSQGHLHLNEPNSSNWRTWLRERSLWGTKTGRLHMAFLWPRMVLDKNDWVPFLLNRSQYKWTPLLCPFVPPALHPAVLKPEQPKLSCNSQFISAFLLTGAKFNLIKNLIRWSNQHNMEIQDFYPLHNVQIRKKHIYLKK